MGLKLNTASSGSVTLEPENTASNYTLTVPAQDGTVVATDSNGNLQVGDVTCDSIFTVGGVSINGDVQLGTTAANYPSDIPAKLLFDIVGQFDTKRFVFNSYGGIAVGTTSSTSTGYSGQVLTSGGEFNGVSWSDIPVPVPSYGAVGSYVFAYANQKVVDGSTYSGSILLPAGGTSSIAYYPDDWSGWSYTAGGSALSGTWRCMGRANGQTYGITLFLRIY